MTSGKRMPLDPDPHPDGNVRILPDGHDEALARVAPPDAPPPTLYRSHFATCPNAQRHRRRP